MESNIVTAANDRHRIEAALAANLRMLREQRGWTQAELAGRAGISKGMVVQVEQARTNPSIATLCKLANALGIALPRLLDARTGPVVRVTAAAEIAWLWKGRGRGSAAGLLAGIEQPLPVELWTWTIAAGDGYAALAHPPDTRELLHVLDGDLVLTVDSSETTVRAGESVAFQADRPHRYAAARRAVRFVMVVVEPLVTSGAVGRSRRPTAPAAPAPAAAAPRRRGTGRRAPAGRPR